MAFLKRAVGAVSRRLDSPELLAAFYPVPRQILREEIALRALLAGLLREDSTYVDVGTNHGQVLREAVRIAPHGRHIAFEPIPSLADDVARAFPAVDCRRLALADGVKSAEFCHFRSMDGWSGLRRSPEISDDVGDPEYITVRVSTLDAELSEVTPEVVKIDVEGAEREVLEGGRSVLARAKPVVIFEHVAAAAALYGTAPAAVWELLVELGYEIFSITGEGPFARAAFAGSTRVINWLARPTSSPRSA
jgi:FkbM family methyltransferase